MEMSALERILTVLDGKIPDKVPSVCLGGDFGFLEKFMKSPYALTDKDMDQLDSDKVSYSQPFLHAIIVKFGNKLPDGLDAKIDLCWQIVGDAEIIKLDSMNDYLTINGGFFKIVVRDEGIPHMWYAGPALLKKEQIKEYWDKEEKLTPKKNQFRNLSKIRKRMIRKYDVVVAQGIDSPY